MVWFIRRIELRKHKVPTSRQAIGWLKRYADVAHERRVGVVISMKGLLFVTA